MTRSNPTETLATLIRLVVTSTAPHLRKTERRSFKTLKGAQAYAVRRVGERPAIVEQWTAGAREAQGPQPNAHSCLTIVEGCTFDELFPALADQPTQQELAARKEQPAVNGVYIIERVLKREAKFWSAWWAEQVRNGCHYCSDAFGRSAYLVSLDGKIDAALGLYCMPACARNAYKNRPAISPMTLASQPARKQQLQHTQLGKQQLQFKPAGELVAAVPTPKPAPRTERCSACEQHKPAVQMNGYGECTACAEAKVARQRAASGLASDHGPAAEAAIDTAIAALPATFGLRNHAGTTYRISRAASFVSGGVIWLYTEALRDGQWLSAMRATPVEILRAFVADPNAQPAVSPTTEQPTPTTEQPAPVTMNELRSTFVAQAARERSAKALDLLTAAERDALTDALDQFVQNTSEAHETYGATEREQQQLTTAQTLLDTLNAARAALAGGR